VQQLLAPREERTLTPVLGPDRYRVRTLDGRGASAFEMNESGEDRLDVVVSEGGTLRASPGVIRPGAEMRIVNETDKEQLVLVDVTGWGEDAATAAEVLVLQEFRDLFSREVLAAGRTAGIGTLTVLFTDLKGSTSLYRDLGDGPAFDRVADHFRLLREAIEPERGSVVKTIGDAVMAVFSEPAGAVRAVLRAHATIGRVAGTPCLVLKTGVHAGPCIAVTLNDRLDYFGSTVNVAARLAGLSEGSDVVMSDPVRQDPGVARLLADEGITPEGFRSPVRGIEGELTLWRTRALGSRE
jgi:adenylate cyclase